MYMYIYKKEKKNKSRKDMHHGAVVIGGYLFVVEF